MSQLRELQQQFTAAMLERDNSLATEISINGEVDGSTRLDIYRSSVKGIHTDAIAAVYPVTQQLVGEHFFLGMSLEYLNAHPSTSGNLHNLGVEMADFIRQFSPAESLPYLSDVAAMEWAWHIAFHSADPVDFPLQKLAEIPQEIQPELIFHLKSGSTLLESAYPLIQIWSVHQPDAGDESVDLNSGDCRLIIHREGFKVSMESLDMDDWNFLNLVNNGLSLQQIAEQMPQLNELLPNAISQGWLTGFSTPA